MHLKSSLMSLAFFILLLTSQNQIQAKLATTGQNGGGMMPHMEHLATVWFTPNALKNGAKMPLLFQDAHKSTSAHFIPKDYSDSIPFSSSKLAYLLNFFGFPQGSYQAISMEDTLTQCETPPAKGETKTCATSLESLLDFVQKSFGPSKRFKVITTRRLSKSSNNNNNNNINNNNNNNILQNYTIVDEPKQASSSKVVACHTMPYPYVVYYCHFDQESKTIPYKVPLMGDNENQIEAIVMCHMDTSSWKPDHISFKVLGNKPGDAPACHFIPEAHLVWVPLLDNGDQGLLKQVV